MLYRIHMCTSSSFKQRQLPMPALGGQSTSRGTSQPMVRRYSSSFVVYVPVRGAECRSHYCIKTLESPKRFEFLAAILIVTLSRLIRFTRFACQAYVRTRTKKRDPELTFVLGTLAGPRIRYGVE
jgi:hypothetical protein